MGSKPASSIGKTLEVVGVVLFVVGLLVWYLGGSSALFRLLGNGPLPQLTLGVVVGSLLLAFAVDRRPVKDILAAAGLLAAGSTLLIWSAVPLLNVAFDRSRSEQVPSQILRVHKPSKGPLQVTVRWREERVNIDAAHAEGCSKDQPAVLHVRDGFLDIPWITQVVCPAK